MVGSDLVTDYKSLLLLSNLRGLVIIDSLTDLETLINLKQLRYLSVEKDHGFQHNNNAFKALPDVRCCTKLRSLSWSGMVDVGSATCFCCLQLFCHLQQ